jgi:putative ABC transport system permease protein
MLEQTTPTRQRRQPVEPSLLTTLIGLVSLPIVVARRLSSHLGLMLTVWAGVTLAVAIVISIPVYAEAAGYRILLTSLSEAQSQKIDNLSPFAIIYRYGGASDDPVSWESYRHVDELAARTAETLGLPADQVVRYAGTEKLAVTFLDDPNQEVMFARLAFQSGIRDQIRIVEGEWPKPWNGQGPIDVLVAETTSSKNTILVDDIYRMIGSGRGPQPDFQIRISGIWRPINPDSAYWFQPPSVLSDQLLIDEPLFAGIVSAPETKWVAYAAWYSAIDGERVRSDAVSGLIDRLQTLSANIEQALPGTELTRSPTESLERHKEQVGLLTVTLALFSVPLLALISYFVGQVAGFVVQRQQQEVAVLRSRGSSRGQILLLVLGEALILALLALIAGAPLGVLIAQGIAWTQSFLRFAPLPGPAPTLLGASWLHGTIAASLTFPAMLLPAYGAAGRTIVSFKAERARDLQAPLWQRLFLDLMLLVPALYGYQQLQLNGMIGVPGVSKIAADDPFRNPILLLAPALMLFACSLVALRFLPRLLSLLAWLFGNFPGVAFVTALRFLARTPRAYGGPVLLIMLTLGLATFTASMARTLDQHSQDRAWYRSGTDARFVSPAAVVVSGGDLRDIPLVLIDQARSSDKALTEVTQTLSQDYFYIPMEDYLTIPGVAAVARVGVSNVDIKVGGSSGEDGLFYAVDRDRLAAVVTDAWRDDYSSESLGSLMNRLADSPQAALVSRSYAEKAGLREGDRFVMTLSDRGTAQDVSFTVAGLIDYFPTLFPEDKPFVIGNIDYSFDSQGGPYQYEIWLDLNDGASIKQVESAALSYGLLMMTATPQRLQEIDTLRPERQGLFGLLSVGFLSTALVTVIGFLTYTIYSFQRRLVELGVLRAIGLGTRQLGLLLIWEQSLVIGIATLLGTGFGILTSRMFVPFLQVRTGVFPDTPPFLVQIAWDQIALIYAIAGGMLVITVSVTLFLLRRMRIFEAVKLGEAV